MRGAHDSSNRASPRAGSNSRSQSQSQSQSFRNKPAEQRIEQGVQTYDKLPVRTISSQLETPAKTDPKEGKDPQSGHIDERVKDFLYYYEDLSGQDRFF